MREAGKAERAKRGQFGLQLETDTGVVALLGAWCPTRLLVRAGRSGVLNVFCQDERREFKLCVGSFRGTPACEILIFWMPSLNFRKANRGLDEFNLQPYFPYLKTKCRTVKL